MIMNTLKILITLLMVMGTAGCSTFLYTAYVPYVPVATYNFANGLITPSPGFSGSEIRVAAVDVNAAQGNANQNLNSIGSTAYTEVGLPLDNDNGQIFADMRTATGYFRGLLEAEQVVNASDYVLTRVNRADDSEFILIAAVYRPQQLIDVADGKFTGIRNVITDKSPAFYEPYRTDHDGRALDKVVAWSLVPVSCFNGPNQQAMVLNETVGAVLEKSPQEEFWAARDQWANDGDAGILMLAGNLMSCPAPGNVQG
jgi:hypothetical protein